MKTGRAEREYGSALRQVGVHVGQIVKQFDPTVPANVPTLTNVLQRYAEALQAWAEATALKMLTEVDSQSRQAWAQLSVEMSRTLQEELRSTPTGTVMRQLLGEQVTLIKSIPLEAAKRVHELTLKGIEDGTRAKEIATEIMRSGDVAASRAMLIARTEVARTASTLTQARAQNVGSDGYVWRTSGDGDVRKDHKELNGKFFRWDDPPVADQRSGARAHAGQIYNCRCWPEPVIPD